MHCVLRCLYIACVLLSLALLSATAVLQEDNQSAAVRVYTLNGAIGPAISGYIQQGIDDSEAAGAYMVVLQMDTPGGLDTAMRDIIQSILDADIPVASYVYPQGARAASAGTYILYASHIAAMAPATNLGAATPVQIAAPSAPSPSGTPSQPAPDVDESENGSEPAASGDAMERKMLNDAIAYIRGLAERNGRNADWAETAVREAASLSAREALAENVVDIVATDIDDLLLQLQGRQIDLKGNTLTLDVENRPVEYVEVDWRTSLLTVLTNPSLILILGMIGIYGLILEFYTAGFGVGGVVGVIFLMLAAYGLQLLPINYAGLGLIILGIIMMIGEAMAPSFGILGLGGIIAFTMGGIMLVDTEVDVFRVSIPLLLAIAAFSAIFLVLTARLFMRMKSAAVVSGLQTIVGRIGHSAEAFSTSGLIKVDGELWQATTDTPLQTGDKVKVLQVDGLQLKVTKVSLTD